MNNVTLNIDGAASTGVVYTWLTIANLVANSLSIVTIYHLIDAASRHSEHSTLCPTTCCLDVNHMIIGFATGTSVAITIILSSSSTTKGPHVLSVVVVFVCNVIIDMIYLRLTEHVYSRSGHSCCCVLTPFCRYVTFLRVTRITILVTWPLILMCNITVFLLASDASYDNTIAAKDLQDMFPAAAENRRNSTSGLVSINGKDTGVILFVILPNVMLMMLLVRTYTKVAKMNWYVFYWTINTWLKCRERLVECYCRNTIPGRGKMADTSIFDEWRKVAKCKYCTMCN